MADDGLTYLLPEIVLQHKARLDREKDRRDLRVTWPLLADSQRAWLREGVRRLQPDHPWLDGPLRDDESPAGGTP